MGNKRYVCKACGGGLFWHSLKEVWICMCDPGHELYVGTPEFAEVEADKNIFSDCSTAESLAWQYIGWTGSILNNQTRLTERTMLADLKEALEHFKKRWEEILNETK